MVIPENHDSVVAGHTVGDASGEARFTLAADAVDQHPGTLSVTKGTKDSLGLAPAADEFSRGGHWHPFLLDVEKFPITRVPAESPLRAARTAEPPAAARAGIDPGHMPMPPAIRLGEMGAQQRSPPLRRSIGDRSAGGQLLVEYLGKSDRIGFVDRAVPADCVGCA